MSETSGASPFAGRTLATIAAIFSLLSTAISAVSAYYAEKAKEQSEATQVALGQSKLSKDYQIQVFQMVDKSLSNDGGLVLASAYVGSLDDRDLKASLAQAIRTVGQVRERAGKPLTDEEKVALGMVTAAVRTADAAPATPGPGGQPAQPPVASPLSNVGATTALAQTKVNPGGWDVDIFWCEARGAASQTLANTIGQALVAEADKGESLAGQTLGRIRVRKLAAALSGHGYPTSTNEVRADPGEELFADALGGVAGGLPGAAGFKTTPSASNTRWYVSMFACGV